MKRLSLILITAFAATFAFSTVNAAVKPVKNVVKQLTNTIVGYQIDGNYVYTFSIDASTGNPHPIAAVTVQLLSNGDLLDVISFSGAINVGIHSIISGTANLSFFNENGIQVDKVLSGSLLGGVVGK
ncbi:hypothetical protein F0L74_18760 [Chitinophaga agrisoli]|uniref:Uncharacterized protein n=1 Tax=Chitinophaga agrisoli TaxID=2607653 RepID=A0A5B2VUB8_9BACT|nr:hypothetical protein [Chitinophaga agrisoli]KAA2241902.1 hypothetical protein F0L74_18760 [Chitinophaga agrisoli]